MYTAIMNATQILNDLGVEVYNASPAGKLDFMQRVDYKSLFCDEKEVVCIS